MITGYTSAVMLPLLTSESKQPWMLSEIPKIGFWCSKKIQNGAEWPFTTNQNFIFNIYKAVCLQNRITVGILMLAMYSASVVQDEF